MLLLRRDDHDGNAKPAVRRLVWRLRLRLLFSRTPRQRLLLGTVLKRLQSRGGRSL